jgi:hypothetical protein
VTLEQAVEREESAEELLGELAHKLSLVVPSEVEVVAVERGPWLHKIAIELAAPLGAALALLLAAAASWAAAEGLRVVLPGWLAAFAVAAFWGVITALLLRIDHPRPLWRRLTCSNVSSRGTRRGAGANDRCQGERYFLSAARGWKRIRLTSSATTVTRYSCPKSPSRTENIRPTLVAAV